MNFRVTAILMAVLLLLVGGLLFFALNDDKPDVDAVLLSPLADLKADDVVSVEIARTQPAEEKLVLARTGKDHWEFRDNQAGRADSSRVTPLIESLLRLKPTMSGDVTSDPAKHGLIKPSVKITLRTDNRRSATLLVGDTTLGGERAVTFVATGENPNRPIAVKRSDLAALFRDNTKDGAAWQIVKGPSEFRLRRLLGADLRDLVANAKTLKIKVGSKELVLNKSAGDWQFDVPPGYGQVDVTGSPEAASGFTGLRGLTTFLTTLTAAGPEDFIENPEPLEKYGLAANDPNLIRIELVPAEGQPEVLLVGKKVDETKPPKYYAQVPGERCIVKIFGAQMDDLVKLVADPKTLQDRTLVKDYDASRINTVDISAGGTSIALRNIMVGSLVRWVIYGSSEPLFAGPAIQNLLTEIAKPRAASEVLPPQADAMFAGAELKAELKFWIDGFAEKSESKDGAIPAEPKLKGGPTMTFLVGKTEGETTYVRRIRADGAKTDFKVPATLAGQMAKKRHDYFDLKFREFATNLANKITFNRGAELFEIDRGDTEQDFPIGKWTFAKPDALKGQIADSDAVAGSAFGPGLLGTLATLSAASIVSEKPTEAELKSWGLDPATPRMKVTVTLNDEKDKERIFFFGNETADKAYVYFRPQGNPIVYYVPRVVLDSFLTADLRDRTPYRFDTKTVKSIKLKGWKNSTGIKELTLERSGDNWVAKTIPSMEINQQSVALLLNHFRAPKPIAVVGGQKPEHGFAAEVKENDPLEVTFLGDKGEIHLNLGNETDGGSNYFAWNSATKEVIKLPSGLFRQFKGGAEFFKK